MIKKEMEINNQKGVIAPMLIILIVVAVVGVGYYLMQGQTNVQNPIANLGKQPDGGKTEVTPSSDAKIQINANSFVPSTITVARGQVVTWVNTDTKDHQIILPQLELDSEALKTNDEYSYTFENAGTYNYHDRLNPLKLKGTVIVK